MHKTFLWRCKEFKIKQICLKCLILQILFILFEKVPDGIKNKQMKADVLFAPQTAALIKHANLIISGSNFFTIQSDFSFCFFLFF